MATKPSSALSLPWLWVIEALASFKQVEPPLLIDLVKRTPESSGDVGKDAREMVSLKLLERLSSQGTGITNDVDSASHTKIGFDPSERCEDVLLHIFDQTSESSLKTAGPEMQKWDTQSFVVHKKSSSPKCTLQKLKEAILSGSHGQIESLKERSGLASPTFFGLTLVFSLAVSLISPALSLTCTSQRLMGNKLYDRCTDLSQFGSYLHWTYDSSNSSLSVAFVAPPATPNGWIAWAINPTATGMLGAQSLVAFRQSNGQMTVKTYNLSSYTAIVESKLSFDVTETSADYSQGLMRLYATIRLPANGTTTVNQVWQVGASVTNGMPVKHDFQPANLNSKGTLDLMSGQSIAAAGGDETTKKRNIHGILNVVSWGIMFPVGAIIARYLRTFKSADPAWFYLHIFCQCCSYVLGVAGWGTGLKLGSESQGVQFNDHRSIGITLFCLATVQIFALFLRPKKEHKFRSYWNIYHHGLGYSIIILGIVNVFVGLHILHPATKWRTGYTILIILLGAIAVLLEAITWIFVLRRKSGSSTKPYDGFNGQDRAQPLAS